MLDPPDSIALARQPLPEIFVSEHGIVYVAPASRTTPLAAFSLAGNLLRSFGSFGGGLLGFQRLRGFHISDGPGNTIAIVQRNKYVLLASDNGALVEQFHLPFAPAAIHVVRDTILAVEAISTGPSKRAYLHFLDTKGSIVASIGEMESLPDWDEYFDARKVTGVASDGGSVWISHINSYELTQYSRSGDVRSRLAREAEWFPQYSTYVPQEPFSAPPRPRVTSIGSYGTADTVITTVSVADEGWHPNMGGARLGGRVTQSLDLDHVFDTIIEIIDVQAGVLVARRRFDEYLVDAGNGYFATIVELSDARFGYRLWRPALLRP
jgi:hypothetical protein